MGKNGKVDCLKTVEGNAIILTWYIKPNERMAINKFQKSRLTLQPKWHKSESYQYLLKRSLRIRLVN